MLFFDNILCTSRAHCNLCRKELSFRQRLHAQGLVDSSDFSCPHGIEAQEEIRNPTLLQLSSNFSKAVFAWAKGGFKIVSKDEFDRRLGVCRQCPLWDEKGYAGWGRCRHGKCQCTMIKHWLATEKCPDGKWEKKKSD